MCVRLRFANRTYVPAERKRKMAAAVKRHYKRIMGQTLPPKLY